MWGWMKWYHHRIVAVNPAAGLALEKAFLFGLGWTWLELPHGAVLKHYLIGVGSLMVRQQRQEPERGQWQSGLSLDEKYRFPVRQCFGTRIL